MLSQLITKFSKLITKTCRTISGKQSSTYKLTVRVFLMARLFYFYSNRCLAALGITEYRNSFIDGDWQLCGCSSQIHWPARLDSFTLCDEKLHIFQYPSTLKNCQRDSSRLCKLNMRSFNLNLVTKTIFNYLVQC